MGKLGAVVLFCIREFHIVSFTRKEFVFKIGSGIFFVTLLLKIE